MLTVSQELRAIAMKVKSCIRRLKQLSNIECKSTFTTALTMQFFLSSFYVLLNFSRTMSARVMELSSGIHLEVLN